MSYCNRNFLTFFFTHEAQSVTATGLKNFVDIVRPSRNSYRPISYPQNTIHLQTGNIEDDGVVSVESGPGEFLFDASNGETVDTDMLDASRTYIDIASYLFKTNSPLLPAAAEMQVEYPSGLALFDLPRNLNNTDGQGAFSFLNPWWIENVIRCFLDVIEDAVVYVPVTVDSDIDSVDQDFTNRKNELLVPAEFNADLGYFVVNEDYDPNIYDLKYCEQIRHELNVEYVPHAELIVLYTNIDTTIESKVRKRLSGRGYVPSNEFGPSMQGANLKDTAIGLLGLLSINDLDLCFSVLEELIYLWAEPLKNRTIQDDVSFIDPQGYGVLPDFLYKAEFMPADISSLPSSRKVLQVAWLTFSVIQVIKRFRNLPTPLVRELPKDIEIFLKHHLYFLASLTDPGTGWVVQEINDFGIATDIRDFETLAVAHLAMAESLSILYDSFIHQRAAISYTRLKDTVGVPDPSDFEQIGTGNVNAEILKAIIAKMLFDLRYGNTVDFPDLVSRFTSILTQDGVIPDNINEFLYIVSRVPNEVLGWTDTDRTQWQLNRFFAQIQNGLYRSVRETFLLPTLEISSWSLMTDNNFNIFPDSPFRLFSEEANAYVAYAYTVAKRMWPFGYRWTGVDFELAKTGVIGSILFSIARQTYAWYLQAALFRDGRSQQTSQAWAVDRWANSVGIERPPLQGDEYVMRKVRARFNSVQSTVSEIRGRLDAFYENVDNLVDTNSIIIKEPELPEVVDFTAPSTYISREWTGSPADVRSVLNSGGHPNFTEPGFLVPPGTGETEPTFVLWTDVAPQLCINAFGYQPNLKQELDNLAPAGVGLKVDLILALRSFEPSDSCVNVTDISIEAGPEFCVLGINQGDIITFNNDAINLTGACCLEGIEFDDGTLWIIDDGATVLKAEGFDCDGDVAPFMTSMGTSQVTAEALPLSTATGLAEGTSTATIDPTPASSAAGTTDGLSTTALFACPTPIIDFKQAGTASPFAAQTRSAVQGFELRPASAPFQIGLNLVRDSGPFVQFGAFFDPLSGQDAAILYLLSMYHYTPSEQGALNLDNAKFAMSFAYTDGPNPPLPSSTNLFIAMLQDNIVYICDFVALETSMETNVEDDPQQSYGTDPLVNGIAIDNIVSNRVPLSDPNSWRQIANDFNTGANYGDNAAVHPDFSVTGSKIYFGFLVDHNRFGGSDQGVIIQFNVSNFNLDFTAEPIVNKRLVEDTLLTFNTGTPVPPDGFVNTGSGTITHESDGLEPAILFGPPGTFVGREGTFVRATATADPGSTFVEWQNPPPECDPLNPVCSFCLTATDIVNGYASLTAIFDGDLEEEDTGGVA